MSLIRSSVVPLLLLLASSSASHAADPFSYPEARHGKGELRYVNEVPVLLVQGTPEEIGEQIAILGVHPAPKLLNYARDILRHYGLEVFFQPLLKVSESMLPAFSLEHRRELDAMVRAGVDPDLALAGNTFFDIKRLIACSALIVEPGRSATQGTLMGRNLDFQTLGYLHEYGLVTVYRPDGKHAFVSVGFPGLIGCLSGMNDAGLCVSVLEVFLAADMSKRFDPDGIPFALCLRRLLEECGTVEEALCLLQSMKRSSRINIAICDRAGGAVFEVTPEKVVVRRSPTGVTPCTNHFRTRQLAPPVQLNFYRTLDRYERLEEAARRPVLGLGDVADDLHAVSFAEHTLQTMIFEPARMRLHVAIGSCPSTASPLRTLDVPELLRAR